MPGDDRWMRPRRCLLALGFMLAPGVVYSQALTLTDAMRIAEERNPVHRSVSNDEDVAAANTRQAWGAYLPDLSANLGFGGSSSRRITTFDEFGNAIRREDPLDNRTSTASQGISLDLLLFDGGRREQQLRAARQDEEAAGARVTSSLVTLRANVARQYYSALGAQRGITLEEQVLQSARDQLAATERRFQIASARREDVLGAQEALLSAEGRLAQAQGESRKQLLLLQELLGAGGDAQYELTDSLPLLADSLPTDAEALVAVALERSPVVREAEAAAAASGRRAAASRGSRWPTVAASAGYSRSLSDRLNQALFDFNPPDQFLNISIGASLPIFSRFQTAGDIARASAQADIASQSLRAARLGLEQEVRAALIDAHNAERRVRLTAQASALSSERVELAEERYRTGGLGLPELQQIVDRAATTERDEIAARVEYATALATLRERVGGELP